MVPKKLCLMMVAVLLASCGGKAAPPPPKPTHLILEIDASGDINPNAEGRASPLMVRFYELKSFTKFNKADFMGLYDKDQSLLGSDLIQKHEVMVQPSEKKTFHFEAADETRVIGAFAAFRKYEQARWRASVNVKAHETSVVRVGVSGTSIDMQ